MWPDCVDACARENIISPNRASLSCVLRATASLSSPRTALYRSLGSANTESQNSIAMKHCATNYSSRGWVVQNLGVNPRCKTPRFAKSTTPHEPNRPGGTCGHNSRSRTPRHESRGEKRILCSKSTLWRAKIGSRFISHSLSSITKFPASESLVDTALALGFSGGAKLPLPLVKLGP